MFRLALLVVTVLATSAFGRSQGMHHLVEVRVTGPAQMRQLMQLDPDFATCNAPLLVQRRAVILATDNDLAALTAAGLRHRVLQHHLEAHYAAAAAIWPQADGPTPPLGQGGMGGHWTLAQMEAILDSLTAVNPAICSPKTAIGTTHEGRSIWLVKISDNVAVDENEPEVLYDALHHSREPLSMETTVVFMEWLVSNYGTDDLATFLVDEREMFFVPCVNPDGYEFNRTQNPGGGGLWRKNRRDNGDGTFGVDLNRNYATGWSAPNGGNSTNTGSDLYRGPAAFSEPETAAIENLMLARQFTTVFSTHTSGDVLLRPWGWQAGDPANVAEYQLLGEFLTAENGITHDSISGLLYIAAGGSIDHHHTVHGAFGWSGELGRASEGGFWPSGPNIAAVANRHQPMFRKHALVAGPALEFESVVVSERAGSGNSNGIVEPGEIGEVTVSVRNVGVLDASGATLGIQSVSLGVAIVSSTTASVGVVARLSNANNAGAPFQFAVAPGGSELVATLRVTLSGDGRSQEQLVSVPLVESRTIVGDDFELDRGFAVAAGGTATTGVFERAAPQQTTSGGNIIQPGVQVTPGGSLCWVTDGTAGSSAGARDVDGGATEVRSPILDLSHVALAEVSLSLWYGESQSNDDMQIGVSRNGGSAWETVYSRNTPTVGYEVVTLGLGSPLTNQMQLRVIAQDQNPSLVECVIDDLAIRGLIADGSITLLGSGQLGSTLQIAMHDVPAAFCFALASPLLGAGTTFPGVGGTLMLHPAATAVLPGILADGDGRAAVDLGLPPNPALAGAVFHWQQASLGSGIGFGGNVVSLTLQ